MRLRRDTNFPAPPTKVEHVRYVLHTEKNPTSIAVGASDTLTGAENKAQLRLGTTYIYKYVTRVDGEEEVLLTPTFEKEVTRGVKK